MLGKVEKIYSPKMVVKNGDLYTMEICKKVTTARYGSSYARV